MHQSLGFVKFIPGIVTSIKYYELGIILNDFQAFSFNYFHDFVRQVF